MFCPSAVHVDVYSCWKWFQIAAKINPGGTSSSQKRSLEDGNEPEPKKVPGHGGDGSGGPSLGPGPAAAQAVAGRLSAPHGGGLGGGMGGPAGLGGGVISEDIKVPDKMVGLSKSFIPFVLYYLNFNLIKFIN